MINREILRNYILATKDLQDKEEKICTALQDICLDNTIFSLVPYSFTSAINKILEESLGEDNANILGWWMYECDYGTCHPSLYFPLENDRELVLDTFDKLYDYMVDKLYDYMVEESSDNNY